ncbi:hypothetical protein N9942_00250 [Akkermansiaceae bacterium]|nr:hypothetical protein [Akkermansiaceae bacterium]MDB4329312.1 hypothetical protein [Akkermansiaceae bacterium]
MVGETEAIFLEEGGEESLHEVFGVLGIFSRAPEVAVEGEPVDLAERGETGGRLGIAFTRGVDDELPSGGDEVGIFPRLGFFHEGYMEAYPDVRIRYRRSFRSLE